MLSTPHFAYLFQVQSICRWGVSCKELEDSNFFQQSLKDFKIVFNVSRCSVSCCPPFLAFQSYVLGTELRHSTDRNIGQLHVCHPPIRVYGVSRGLGSSW